MRNQDNGKIAFVTIGQSPRHDIVDEMMGIVKKLHHGKAATSFVHYGALDNLDRDEIDSLQPRNQEGVLVTRLQSGESVKVAENRLEPYMQTAVYRGASQADLVVLLCTGSFANLTAPVPLIFPDQVFLNYCFSVLDEGTLGIVVPDESQIQQRLSLWKAIGKRKVNTIELKVRAASPYKGREEMVSATQELATCDLIALDCMGYTLASKQDVSHAGGSRVALARSVTAMAIAELL